MLAGEWLSLAIGVNLTAERRCVGISWRFAFVGADYEPFFSGSFLAPQWPASVGSWYSYLTGREDAHRLNMPFWCIYSPGRDVGVTLATDLGTPCSSRGAHGMAVSRGELNLAKP